MTQPQFPQQQPPRPPQQFPQQPQPQQPPQCQHLQPAPAPMPPMPIEQRAALLDAAIADAVRKGWTVQHQSQFQAVITKNKRIGFWINALLVLITMGLWLFVIVYRALNRKQKTRTIAVDAYGRVTGRP